MAEIFVRSLIYNIVFYVWLIFLMILALPTLLMPREGILGVAKFWARSSIWLLRVICNTRVEYRGLDRIPQGPLLVASKHQSIWETFALLQFFDKPLYILKRELKFLPMFGWYLIKADMIDVDRAAGGRTLTTMARRANEEVTRGRQLIIFPEGTRRPVGAEPRYKLGVGQIYVDCAAPCLPIALNSGLFWPRRTFLRFPGTIVIECLDLIPSGLSRQEFLAKVSSAIETASDRLLDEGRREQAMLFDVQNKPPVSD